MRKTNINYPHPVLSASNDDYLNSSFDLMFEQEPTVEGMSLRVDLKYELNCDGLSSLIENEDAYVVIYFECSQSEFRHIEKFKKNERVKTFNINKNELGNVLDVKCYIIAQKDIQFFKLEEHNQSLFGDFPFNIKRGDILAITESYYRIPIENYDPLADRPSIFSIRKQTDHPNEEISVDFLSHPKITIFLNEETFAKYEEIHKAPETRGILASLFAIPVLVDVLSYMKNATDDEIDNISQNKWYQVLTTRLTELKIDLQHSDSMTQIANSIIPHVFKSNLDQFKKVFENIIGSDGGEQ